MIRSDNRIPVLMYHEVSVSDESEKTVRRVHPGYFISVEQFEKQIEFLSHHNYRSLTLNSLFHRTLDPAWKLSASRRADRISFQNEGKPGEIYALAGTHCFAERAVPADTALVEAVVQPGTDKDASWGPGLGLVVNDSGKGVFAFRLHRQNIAVFAQGDDLLLKNFPQIFLTPESLQGRPDTAAGQQDLAAETGELFAGRIQYFAARPEGGLQAVAQILKLGQPLPQTLKVRVAGGGLFQEPFDPGGSAERAPDGQELFRNKTGRGR